MKTQNSTANFRNNSGAYTNKPHLTRRSTHVASKENNNFDGYSQQQQQSQQQQAAQLIPTTTGSCLNMSRAFQVIQTNAETSYAALENPNCPNMIAKHVQKVAARALSSGRRSLLSKQSPQLQPSSSQSMSSILLSQQPSLRNFKRSWTELCPCKKDQKSVASSSQNSLVEERDGNFNCSSCGAMAFHTGRNGAKDDSQSIFAIKLQEERSKVETPPQKILEQLRETSQKQRTELRALLPQNDTFDERVLQVRDTILELICEVGDCLKQSQLTIHLAVEYLDRFLLLRNSQVGRSASKENGSEFVSRLLDGYSADDIALTSLLLASKFDEIDDNIPLIQEMNKGHSLVRDSLDSGFLLSQTKDRPRLTKNRSYPGFHAIQRCELYFLRVLSWDLNSITPLHFVHNHLYQGVLFTNDTLLNGGGCGSPPTDHQRKALQKVRRHIDYFALQAIKQEFMLCKTYSDQTVAAAIIFAARKASKVVENAWNEPAFRQMFGINKSASTSIADIQDCFNVLYRVYDKSHTATSTFKSNSEVIAIKNEGTLNPFKIEINFQNVIRNGKNAQVASCTTVETERATNLSNKLKEAASKSKISARKVGSSDQGGLSTRGCEATNSDNSAVETLAQSMTNNEEFSQNVENSQSMTSSAHENSSSSGIEESIEMRNKEERKCSTKISQPRKSKSKKSSSQSKANKTKTKSQKQSNSKTGEKKTISSKSSVTTFDQQTTLKPTFANSQSDVAGCSNNKSLSPIKEFRDRDGPIKVFKQQEKQQREPRAVAIRNQNSRERSDSSTSMFRLQPTMVRTSDVSTLNKTTTHPHLFLQPRAIVSDESQAKRNNCTYRSSSKQSTTPPNVLNFSSQSHYCNNNNKSVSKLPPSRKSGDKGTTATVTLNKTASEDQQPPSVYHQKSNAKIEITSDVSVQDLTKNSRNSEILILEEKHQRLAMSKSFVYPQATRNNSRASNNIFTISSHQNEKSEAAEIMPEKFAASTAGAVEVVATEGSDNFSSNLKHQDQQQNRSTSALSQIKTPVGGSTATTEIGNVMRNNNHHRDQNFIKRNINYVTKLDQKTKERKSLHASRSFIENDNNKSKASIPYESSGKYDHQVASEQTKVNDLQKYNEQAPKMSRYGGAKSLKRFTSTAIQKSQYMSNQVNETQQNAANVQLLTSTNVVIQKDETHQTTVTPKQMSYRPSKLFSKKQGAAGNSSTNTSVAEQPRSSNPTKTALHKFKTSHRTNSFGGVGSLHSRNNQHRSGLDQSCSTQADTQQQLQVSRDLSQTPLDTSSANVTTTLVGTTANKQRPQNNHLKPTKSSLLRAKSSLGLTAAEDLMKFTVPTTTVPGGKVPTSVGGSRGPAVTTTMVNNEQQVLIKFNNIVGGCGSTRAGSQSRLSQQSPQFGGLRARKFQSNESSQVPLAAGPLYTSNGCYGGVSKLEVDLTVPTAFITSNVTAANTNATSSNITANETPVNAAHQTQRDRKSTAKSQTGPTTRRHHHHGAQQQAAVASKKQTATAKNQHPQQQQTRESTATNHSSNQAFRGTFSIR